jgi:hypothetical protein
LTYNYKYDLILIKQTIKNNNMLSEIIKNKVGEMKKSGIDEDFLDPKFKNIKVFLKKPEDEKRVMLTLPLENETIYIGK